MKIFKLLCKLFLVSLLIGVILFGTSIDLKELKLIFQKIKPSTCIFILFVFIVNFHLVVVRNFISYKQFNIHVSLKQLFPALLSGMIGGIIPIYGSSITQSYALNKYNNIPPSTSVLLYFYDKIIMMLSGLFLASIATFFLFKNWSFLQAIAFANAENSPFELSLAMLFCIMITVTFIIPKKRISYLKRFLKPRSLYYFAFSFFLSIITWLLSSYCFMQCVHDYYGASFASLKYIDVFSGCCLISFLASMPISANGWGVRELAAIKILSFFQIPAAVSLSTAITVGIFSSISLLILSVTYFSSIFFIGDAVAARK